MVNDREDDRIILVPRVDRQNKDFAVSHSSPHSAMLFALAGLALGLLCVCAGAFLVNQFGRTDHYTLPSESPAATPKQGNAEREKHAPPPQLGGGVNNPNTIYLMIDSRGASPTPVISQGYQSATVMQQVQGNPNALLAQNYPSEFVDFLRANGRLPDYGGYAALQTSPTIFGSQGANALIYSNEFPLLARTVTVPNDTASYVKQRLSKNVEVESWLASELSPEIDDTANDTTGDGKDGGNNGGEPSMDDILRRLAETTFADKQYEKTARIYAELSAKSAKLSMVELIRWAKAAELMKDNESALKVIEIILQNDPNNVSILRDYGSLLTEVNKFSEAAEVYQKLMGLEPNKRNWRVQRAKCLVWSKRNSEAIDLLKPLTAEMPEDRELEPLLLEVLLAQRQYDDAIALIDKVSAASPGNTVLMTQKLDLLMTQQRFKDAEAICVKLLEKKPGDPDLLLKLANCRMALQDFSGALDPIEQYLAHKPDDTAMREQFADCLLATGDNAKAASQFELLLEADPNSLLMKKKYADALLAAKNYAKAEEVFQSLMEANPKDRDALQGLVLCLRQNGNQHKAMSLVDSFLSKNPGDAKMMIEAADIATEMKNPTSVVKWLRSAQRLDPFNNDLRIRLADALGWAKRYSEAESEYRKALSYQPSDFKTRRGLARALYFQKKYAESLAIYREIAEEDPLNGSINSEYKLRCASVKGMNIAAEKELTVLKEENPDELVWKKDLVQNYLGRSQFAAAEAQACEVLAEDPNDAATSGSLVNMNNYLNSVPVTARAGMLRKSSSTAPDAQQDRLANMGYYWAGLHGEKSLGYDWRLHSDLDYEKFDLRTPGMRDVNAQRLKMGLSYFGNPVWRGSGEIGYRWFGSNGPKNQWVYNVRAEADELGNMPLQLILTSGRNEYYDNYLNFYDDMYSTSFGAEGIYRYKRWDFNGFLKTSILTDDNYNVNVGGGAKYRIYDEDRFRLAGGPFAEYLSWRYNRPTYFSPNDYGKVGIGISGRSYLSGPSETWGDPASYLDFGYSLYLDNKSSVGHRFSLGFNHDFGRKFSAFAKADYARETYYNELSLFGGLTYSFGGCE